ncbi:MAG: DUF427 domain-containing protein [Gammaproteobacteria bacterium]
MATAKWNGKTLAESDDFETVEGNVYFPRNALKKEYFRESSHTSTCPWKGVAHYYDVCVDGKVNADAAWYYPEPKEAASRIKDHVAFWKGIEVTL